MKSSAWMVILIQLMVASALSGIASAHLFAIRSEPRVGRTIAAAPAKVRIWFNGELEETSSKMAIYDSTKRRVDKGNCRVTGSGSNVLEVDLPPLLPGTYRVYYKVRGKDKHFVEGDYSFILTATKP